VEGITGSEAFIMADLFVEETQPLSDEETLPLNDYGVYAANELLMAADGANNAGSAHGVKNGATYGAANGVRSLLNAAVDGANDDDDGFVLNAAIRVNNAGSAHGVKNGATDGAANNGVRSLLNAAVDGANDDDDGFVLNAAIQSSYTKLAQGDSEAESSQGDSEVNKLCLANPEAKKVYQYFYNYVHGTSRGASLCSLKRGASEKGTHALEDTLLYEGSPKKLKRTVSSAYLFCAPSPERLPSSQDSNAKSDAESQRATLGGDTDAESSSG
jgi:hypothetical protein